MQNNAKKRWSTGQRGTHAGDEYTRTIEPARARAAETLKLERKLKAEG